MDRREAISKVGLLLGGIVTGANIFIQAGCSSTSEKINDLFNQEQVSLLNEIAETILPATDTPGAKAAGVGEFMAVVVKDCYNTRDQKIFLDGIDTLNVTCRKKYGKEFISCDQVQRNEFLNFVDAEQEEYIASKKSNDPDHYFRMMKELTLLGYFTSEAGATQALAYVAVPGKYEGCVPLKPGQKAWASA